MNSREIAEKLVLKLRGNSSLSEFDPYPMTLQLVKSEIDLITTALEERERAGYERGIEDALFTIEEGPPHAIYRNIRALAHKARGENGEV